MDDLELQRLKAVADAVPAVLDLLFADNHRHDGRVIELSVALDILKGRNISNEHGGREYNNGPWATVSDYDPSEADIAGGWHFPGPDVSMPKKAQIKLPIQIEWLEQGFLAEYGGHKLGFSNGVDTADWLLDWLGFGEEIVESVRDILAGLWDADELVDKIESWEVHYGRLGTVQDRQADHHRRLCKMEEDYAKALGVARAAQAYVEVGGHTRPRGYGWEQYDKLIEAVKKWQGIEGG